MLEHWLFKYPRVNGRFTIIPGLAMPAEKWGPLVVGVGEKVE
jgi:hypothetical protein